MSDSERRARLAHRHFLSVAPPDLETLARRLVGIHTSDPTTPYLAARARMPDFEIGDLDVALFERRSLIRMVGMRRTLFVIPRELAAWFDAGCNRKNTESQTKRLVRMMEEQGLAEDGRAWIEQAATDVLSVLAEHGPTSGRRLNELVPSLRQRLVFGEGKKWGGGVAAGSRVLFLLASRGDVIRSQPLGSWVSGQYRWAETRSWLDQPITHLDSRPARAALVASWLKAHGPGTFEDIQWWGGWTKSETSEAIEDVGVEEVGLEHGQAGFVLSGDIDPAPQPTPRAWLLPSLDPSVMGWKRRDFYLGSHAPSLFDSNGNGGPSVWWNGRMVGAWSQAVSGEVRHELVEDVGSEAVAAIDSEAHRLETWLDGVRIMPRFQSPLGKKLANG